VTVWRLVGRMLRSRLLRWALLVITAVVVAFWMAFVAAAAVVIATIGTEAAEANPDRVTSIAVPSAVLASVVAVVAVAVFVRARQRSRIRQWLPVYNQMVHDSSRPSEHLAQVLTEPSPEAGGHVIATDLVTGGRSPLLLPGQRLPIGAIVSFTDTHNGAQVRAWMTARLWRSCEREAARIQRRSAGAFARAERDRRAGYEADVRREASNVFAEAERVLRQQQHP
jgi:hypothetical protein